MGRNRNDRRLDEICELLQGQSGQKAGTIAQQLGLDNKTLMRALTQLEDRGDLLFEDDDGRLGWFGKHKK